MIEFSRYGKSRRVHTHSENPKHQRRWKEEDHVRLESHQGYR